MKLISQILIFILVITAHLSGQENFRSYTQSKEYNQIINLIFDDIEVSIREANVANLSKYLGAQTYFSLFNGVSGYYSPNQAYYILEDFFNFYRVTAFKFNQIRKDKANPYATGTFSFDNKGKRSSAKVYISLKKIGDKWNITQLTINQ